MSDIGFPEGQSLPPPLEKRLDPDMAKNEAMQFVKMQTEIMDIAGTLPETPGPDDVDFYGEQNLAVINDPKAPIHLNIEKWQVRKEGSFPFAGDITGVTLEEMGNQDLVGSREIQKDYGVLPECQLIIERDHPSEPDKGYWDYYYFGKDGKYVKVRVGEPTFSKKVADSYTEDELGMREMTAGDFELVGMVLQNFKQEVANAAREPVAT